MQLKHFLFSIILFSTSTAAFESGQFYRVKVPVADRSAKVATWAMQQAASEVLIKATGQPDVLSHPVVRQILNQPERYVTQYGYSEATPDWAKTNPEQVLTPQLFYEVQFDSNTLTQTLKKAGLPVWGRHRPVTLAWVVVDDGVNRRLVGQHSQRGQLAQVRQALLSQAAKRGVPLIFPLLDLVDNEQISQSDVWGQFLEPIKAASGRYQSDAVWLIRFSREEAGEWQANWQLLLENELLSGGVRHQDLPTITQQMNNEITQALAERFAFGSLESGIKDMTLRILDVEGPKAYAKILSYLKTLAPLSKIDVEEVGQNEVIIKARVTGGEIALKRALAIDRLMSFISISDNHVTLKLL